MKNFTLIALSALLPSLSHAFGFSDIVNWTGSGANEAALLIDWQDGSAHPSLVWGYRWDGSATGEQMAAAVAAADPELSVQITSYSFGDAVTAIGYDGAAYGANGPGSHYQSGFSVGTPGFWAYYTGAGPTLPTWNESGVGFGDRILADQAWDGWGWSANFNDTPPSNAPMAAPVPEPAPLLALAGAMAASLRRCRRRASGPLAVNRFGF